VTRKSRDATLLSPHDEAVRQFAQACRHRDVAALRAILATDAIAVCDSDGRVPDAVSFICGAERIADLITALLRDRSDVELAIEAVNGHAGLTVRSGDRAAAVADVAVTGAKISALWVVVNPAKLRSWSRV
jgi:hypothetical protein